MNVERNFTITTTTLSDWLKIFAPDFQLMRRETTTNRILYTRFFPCFQIQITSRNSEGFIALFVPVMITRSNYFDIGLLFFRPLQFNSQSPDKPNLNFAIDVALKFLSRLTSSFTIQTVHTHDRQLLFCSFNFVSFKFPLLCFLTGGFRVTSLLTNESSCRRNHANHKLTSEAILTKKRKGKGEEIILIEVSRLFNAKAHQLETLKIEINQEI